MSDMYLNRALGNIAKSLEKQAHQEKVRNAIYAINSLRGIDDEEIRAAAREFLKGEFRR